MALSRNRIFVVLAVTALVSSCGDYMNRRDTVSARAGDAMEANAAVHEVSPWPPYVENTNVN
jgi:hypothetical protein